MLLGNGGGNGLNGLALDRSGNASLSAAPYALADGSNRGQLLDRGSSSLGGTGHTLADVGGSGCTLDGSDNHGSRSRASTAKLHWAQGDDGLLGTAHGNVPLVAACANSLLSAAHGGS